MPNRTSKAQLPVQAPLPKLVRAALKLPLAALLTLSLLPGLAQAQTTPTPAPASATPANPTPATTTPANPAPATPVPATVPAAPAAAKPRPPASSYVALGVLYYDQGNFDDAYLAFRAAAEADPKNAEALLGLGRTQSRLRLYGPSLDTLGRLTTQDPRNVSGYLALAQAYQAQYVGTSERSGVLGNLDAALKVLDSAEVAARGGESDKLDISLSKIANERGYIYRLQGQSARAIATFKQANALNPDNGVILYNLGDMYYATGNITEALGTLQLAVIANPSDPFNRAYYAKLLALSGNPSAARAEAAQAAKLSPKNPYAVGQYGVVAYLGKDWANARTQLQASIKLEPLRYPEFYYYLGRLELDQANLKEARNNLTKSVALASTNPEYLYYLGLSYERSAATAAPDKLRAIDSYTRALKLNPGYKLAQDGLNRVK
ncbi:tetratricopeptide repeat protein [Deinococcus sp.]|uniref:tetratricopeptide repeat protein n=1 Tax=Deinococcus sp. TaxID=47478 RepID=UPI0025E4A3D6|nr:tetratricopeptide repeat protein [Deinococcus sp.]